MKIGILREGKVPIDKRTPLTPKQASLVEDTFPGVEVVIQSSENRIFPDSDYEREGLKVARTVDDCEILLGVKEVPIQALIEGRTYLFFSHTIKEQDYNRDLLQEILRKKIRLIDYEVLTDPDGVRLIAFGRYAGIVGAYNGILALGKRYNLYEIRRAFECDDLDDLRREFGKVKLPAIKIALTGGGRVTRGAMEVLMGMGIHRVSPHDYVHTHFDYPVFAQLNSRDYHITKDGSTFDRDEFFKDPSNYVSDFQKYTKVSDMLIAAAYWDPRAPVLFNREDILRDDFSIKVIADITMDIEGSIPSTKRSATIEEMVYDYNPSSDKVEKAYRDESNITVMAVDNLPCELSRDASKDFGVQLIKEILPPLLGEDEHEIIGRATIARGGKLTDQYSYLQPYVDGE